jgi:hypothetical protein
MTNKLRAEDVDRIVHDLCSRYPILILTEMDKDIVRETLNQLLGPYVKE